ncbi:MAG: hypothetical protein KBB55_03040 [Candidatus Buchananbacteria bacterium]|nr:hypothetical protein [Candidatus Buchananbacteria bacterium]
MNPENPTKVIWFKRKRYGYGWYPSTWQGWLVIAVYIAILAALSLTLDETAPPREVAFMFVLPVVFLTAALLRICYRFGERPRWQWGKGDDDR